MPKPVTDTLRLLQAGVLGDGSDERNNGRTDDPA